MTTETEQTTEGPTPQTCRNCGQTKAEHMHVNLRCFLGSDEYFEPVTADGPTPRTDAERVMKALPARDTCTAARLFWGSQYIASVGASDDTPQKSFTMAEKLALRYNVHPDLVAALETIANPRRGYPEERWNVEQIANFARAALARAKGGHTSG